MNQTAVHRWISYLQARFHQEFIREAGILKFRPPRRGSPSQFSCSSSSYKEPYVPICVNCRGLVLDKYAMLCHVWFFCISGRARNGSVLAVLAVSNKFEHQLVRAQHTWKLYHYLLYLISAGSRPGNTHQ